MDWLQYVWTGKLVKGPNSTEKYYAVDVEGIPRSISVCLNSTVQLNFQKAIINFHLKWGPPKKKVWFQFSKIR